MRKKDILIFIFIFIALSGVSFAYDVSVTTDKYYYATNENIYSHGIVKINSTSIANVSVAFSVMSGSTAVDTQTFTTNSTGQFNYTFSLGTAGNYTLLANASGDFVQHSIKINPYKSIILTTDKPTYSTGSNGTLTFNVIDASNNGVASQVMSPGIYYTNKTLHTSLSSCTTDTLGECRINFTAPSTDGEYMIAVNNFEDVIGLVVGGFEPSLKITPAVGAISSSITIKVIVKSAGGSGVAAAGRQLVVTTPGGTEYTTATMTQYYDDSGTAVTGVYQDTFSNTTEEGVYSVKVTITPQGSNVTRVLYGTFEIRGYTIDIVPWFGSSVFYPGSSISMGIRLRNASSNEFFTGKASTVKSGITIYDTSNKAMTLSTDVTEYSAMSMYKLDFTMPSTSKAGTYRIYVYINDSAGSGSANGYFTIQTAKPEAMTFDKFNGSSKKDFLSGEQVAARFSARNASGYLNVLSISSYGVYDEFGNDVTSRFLNRANYTAMGSGVMNGWINLTTPKTGGWYILRAKLVTGAGDVVAETGFEVAVLDIQIMPITSSGSGQSGGGMMGGPGYMFYFKPNDTVRFNVTVTTAQEVASGKEFMGSMKGMGGPSGGMMGGGYGGMGGGTAVSGAKATVTKIINIQTEEDVTSTATITNGVTGTDGSATISLKSAVNNQQWNGGFYVVFVQVNSTDNQTDTAEGFFEVRRYFLKIDVSAATNITAQQFGFNNFNNWIIGPADNVNVSVTVVEPGTWQNVNTTGNLTINGIYYGGAPGEFVFPPKLITGTNKTIVISGSNSTVINAPSAGWKSGFYQVRATVNISGSVDTGESFMMSKSFEGWAEPVNPTTLQSDFTTKTLENVTFQINVFDVKNHAPAANLSVMLSKIMTFQTFPPSEMSYTENVSTGTTDSSGRTMMTLPYPAGSGWNNGEYLAVFSVTNGTVTDTIEGYFQVKPFFVDMQPTRWQYANNETVAFDVTISSDPSWMRMSMGGGCSPSDPMCGSSGGGGGQAVPIGGGAVMNTQTVSLTEPSGEGVIKSNNYDLDNDGTGDITITANLSQNMWANITTSNVTKKISFKGCFNPGCNGSITLNNGFEGFDCSGGTFNENNSINSTRSYKLNGEMGEGPRAFCVQTSAGKIFKVSADRWFPDGQGPKTGYDIKILEYSAGSVGGNNAINATGGTEYYNATLKSIKVTTFNWMTGETVVSASAYNVTSNDEATVGVGNITIPGSGRIKLKPNTQWSGEYFNIMAEFNVSTTSEFSGSGFAIASYMVNCYRMGGWGPVAAGQPVQIYCQVQSPSGGNYSEHVDINVSRVRNTWTWQNVDTSTYGISPSPLHTNSTSGSALFNITTTSMSNGQYEAEITFNSTSVTKTSYIWFEVKDFEPVFYATQWTFSGASNITFTAFGTSGGSNLLIPVNISSAGDFILYRYDRSTWAKTQVTGVTARSNIAANNITTISLSKSGGWDEGNYEIVLNLSRVGATGKVEVRSWFEVRLFNVWAWTQSWSNYPTDNVTIYIGAEQPGTWGQTYNGTLIFNITSVVNTRTGQTLVKGIDFTTIDNTTNLANIPQGQWPKAAVVKLIPLNSSGFPMGDYKITVRVTETGTGSVETDTWMNVVSFYLNVWTDRWEYASAENVTINYNAYRPDGASVSLASVNITRMDRCSQQVLNWICNQLNLSNISYSVNTTNKIITLSTSGFTEGQYHVDVTATDNRGASSMSGTGFKIGSFSFNGFIQQPAGRDYYINENMTLNVTGTTGINVTNATFRYWSCPFSMGGTYAVCSEQTFTISIGTVLTSQNQLITLQPPLNATTNTRSWPNNAYGDVYYDIDVYATKDGDTRNLRMNTRTIFPMINPDSIITDSNNYGPNSNITSILTVCLDSSCTTKLGNVNISVFRVIKNFGTTTQTAIGSSGNWTTTTALTNSTGSASIILSPTGSFTWTLGTMVIVYEARYGSSSTLGYDFVNVYQPTIFIINKVNSSSTDTIQMINATTSKVFDITITFGNPTAIDATNTTVRLSLPMNSLNTTTSASNLTSLTRAIDIPTNSTNSTFWTFNVSQTGNYTGMIYITPSASGLYSSNIPYAFTVSSAGLSAPGKVTLLSPADGSSGLGSDPPVEFKWNAVTGATSYNLYYTQEFANGTTQITDASLSGASIATAYNATLGSGALCTWKVRAGSAAGYGSWSDTRYLSRSGLAAPAQVTLLSPDSGYTFPVNQSALLIWNATYVTMNYTIFYEVPGFLSGQNTTTATNMTIASGSIIQGTPVLWYVRANNLAGSGINSETRNFTMASS